MYVRVTYSSVEEAKSAAAVIALLTGRPLRHPDFFVKLWSKSVDRSKDSKLIEFLRLR